jgi:anti-anti-sigma factor
MTLNASAESPRLRPGAVELAFEAHNWALVQLHGECDLNTRNALAEALERASQRGAVLVDLSHCSFIDGTVIGTLVVGSQKLRARGGRLDLVVPPHARAIHRIVGICGLTTLVRVHDTRRAGLAS